MSQIHIFDAIKTEELERMVTCFNGQIKSFPVHKKLITDASDSKTIGVILSGEADLIKYDYDGYRNILEHLSARISSAVFFFRPPANRKSKSSPAPNAGFSFSPTTSSSNAAATPVTVTASLSAICFRFSL